MPKKVVVGMSGGVDSSVAAYLLKKEGCDVIGVTMQIWQDEERTQTEEFGGCCGISAVDDARRVAEKLDIPYYVLNFKQEFKEKVIDYFIDEYMQGLTPNPCIACNKHVKWESMLNKALAVGSDYIATGHYANIIKHPKTGRFTLKMTPSEKDQTYALYNLTQFQLKHTLMPIGKYEKSKIREIAKDIGLNVANKPDSQDICFVPDGDYNKFISKSIGKEIPKGNFVDLNGNILGQHQGITKYTVGQRKGLGISYGKPLYVYKINVEKNEVVLVENEDLFKREVLVKNFNFMGIEDFKSIKAFGKLRYSQPKSPCVLFKESDEVVKIIFDEPQRAVAPGQAAVFYDEDDYVIGGGIIL